VKLVSSKTLRIMPLARAMVSVIPVAASSPRSSRSASTPVALDRDGNIRLQYTPSNPTAADRLYHRLKGMLGRLGMHSDHLIHRFAYMKSDIPVAGVAHQAGTCRFGTDPATSVLDAMCRAHELDNLYVVDTSFFPSISAMNPALTAMANALRVGDHLLDRMGARAQTATAPTRGSEG